MNTIRVSEAIAQTYEFVEAIKGCIAMRLTVGNSYKDLVCKTFEEESIYQFFQLINR